MSVLLHVATRKGLLDFRTVGAAWRLQRTSFVGDPVTAVLSDARDGARYAALNLGHFGVKLHRSDDEGETWREVATPAFEAAMGDAEGKPGPSVSQIWCLAAGGPEAADGLWAGTIPGGLFHSADRGETWSLVDGLWHQPSRPEWFGGGYDEPGIHSVCVDPRDPRRLAVGISCGGVWRSEDGGTSWRVGSGLRAAFMPPDRAFDPVIQDPHRLAACAAAPAVLWCQHHNGIFRSTDGGASFTEIEAEAPSRFGFAVAAHPHDAESAWFVPAVKDECRVPVDQTLVVLRTRDGGASFEVLSEGLPPPPAFDLVYRHGLDVDAAGERLAMGSTTGNLWLGEAEGARWSPIAGHLPPINQVVWGP